MSISRSLFIAFFCSVFCFAHCKEYTIMYYNILWYNKDTKRDLEYVKILEKFNPDIIVAIELSNRSDDEQFFRNVIKEYDDDFRKGEFHPSGRGRTGCDINIYYNRDEFELLDQNFIKSDPRDFALYKIFHKESEEEFRIIGAHLKASKGGENEIRRERACQRLVKFLDENDMRENVIFGGDFNFYESSEGGYQLLVNDADLFDPLGPGDWHDNEEFRDLHTQSTRKQRVGGGSAGGLDDRFDFILFSKDFLDADDNAQYVIGSYKDIGNDGGDFNESVNDGNNEEVSKEIANALFNASDHLPVVIKINLN